jgi:hypothetical protein
MATKYIINGELTDDAHLSIDLIKKCTFNVGTPSAVKINDSEAGTNKPKNVPAVQYYQKFIEISYPNGEKSASCVLPACVIHHDVHDYYGKPSAYVGVPQALVAQMKLKLSATGHSPQFQDKRILSDAKYWWNRISLVEAMEGKEYIRVFDEQGECWYGSFADLFADYPTSMLCNITCTLKLKGEAPAGQPLKGDEEWRVGMQVSMITPYDAIEVAAPSTGAGQRSIAGAKDRIKPGLSKFKKAQA